MVEACWKKIGTQGDHSCPKLAELAHCRNCTEFVRAARTLLDREVPAALRAFVTGTLTEPKEETRETIALIVFRVATEWLALPAGALEQVVEERMVHVVPGRSNRSFRGLVNIDGELLLCYSAPQLLGMAEAGSPRRMLVMRQGAERMVFSADEIAGMLRIETGALQKPPATVEHSPSALTKAIFHHEGRSAGLLDTDKWISCAARSIA